MIININIINKIKIKLIVYLMSLILVGNYKKQLDNIND